MYGTTYQLNDKRPPVLWDLTDERISWPPVLERIRTDVAAGRWVRVLGPDARHSKYGCAASIRRAVATHFPNAYEVRSRTTGKQSCVFVRYVGPHA